MTLKYRLDILGWYNFEALVQLLLKEFIGPGVTSFGGSKDGGRDAYFEGEAPFPSQDTRWSGRWIFQAKFSDIEAAGADAPGKRLLNELKEELRRIVRRRRGWPKNYVLLTNVRLTASARDSFEEMIRSLRFGGNFRAVDGREICEFLDLRPSVRRAFPQLIGLADLDLILNKDLYARAQAFVANWQPKLATFVAVKQYIKALEVLRKHHFVVLDGPPEAGKTTIGAALTLAHAAENFEVVFVTQPNEVFRIYDATRDQIYFADDAVGSITFDPGLGSDWSRELPGILRKLDSRHKLIWTARSYILNEALAATKLREQVDDFPGKHEVLVEVNAFSLFERARILYNHVKTSQTTRPSRLLIKKYATRISSSRNFTPERVRRLVIDVLPEIKTELSVSEQREWLDKIEAFFNDPGEAFRRAYDKLGGSEKELLLSLLSLEDSVSKEDLKNEYERRISAVR